MLLQKFAKFRLAPKNAESDFHAGAGLVAQLDRRAATTAEKLLELTGGEQDPI